MDDKALCLIAQFDEETDNKLSGCYNILSQHGFDGQQTKNIPYHFTLGSYGLDYEKQILTQMEEICFNTNIIDIYFSHIGLFGLKVLFIEPNINFELLSLQKSFFPNCGNGSHPWTAHATLLMDEPDMILKAIPVVVECFEPFHAKIESISLYEFFPARFIKECKLKIGVKI